MNERKRKIMLLLTSFTNGGVETQVTLIARRLKELGCEIVVVSLLAPDPPEKCEALLKQGIDYRSLYMRKGKASLKKFARFVSLVSKERPHVLCTFMYHANVLGRITRLFIKIPIVVSSIRTENFGSRRRELIIRFTNFLADRVVVNSRRVQNDLIIRKIIKRENSSVITNGIDSEQFDFSESDRANARHYFNINKEVFLWAAIGRIEAAKDYPLMLNAFKRVLTERDNARLIIAGKGSLFEEVRSLTRELEIETKVTFLGDVKDCRTLLAACDALVMSSAWEGMPNAVMEALASGRPVVSTNIGGVSELIEDGISGFLVSSRCAETLSNSMIRLMDLDFFHKSEMSRLAKERVNTEFDYRRLGNDYCKLFAELEE